MICASLYFDFYFRISSFIFEKILLPHTPKFRGDYREEIDFEFFGEPVGEGVELAIVDEQGQAVETVMVSSGQSRLSWSGLDENDQPVSPGQYRAVLRDEITGATLATSVRTQAEVEEIRVDGGLIRFQLADGSSILEGDILAVR